MDDGTGPASPGRPVGGRGPVAAGGRVQWGRVFALAAVGTVLAVALVLVELSQTTDRNGWLIHTGPDGPAAALLAEDFPDRPQFRQGEHDGPMFYAVAVYGTDLDGAASQLDRPRYRLQRPVYPALARLLYPPGRGEGLVWSMFAVGVLACFGGGVALGALSQTLRGPPGLALLFPLLPGSLMSLRLSVSDGLAVALVLGAIVLSLRDRHRWALLLAVAAVLTKEPVYVTLVAFALWRRDRQGLALALAPAVVAGGWALFLRSAVPEGEGSLIDLVPPFTGVVDALGNLWARGNSLLALGSFLAAVGLGVWGLVRRGWRHPLSLAVAANLGFLMLWNITVVGLDRNGTRTAMMAVCLGAVLVAAPGGSSARPASARARA